MMFRQLKVGERFQPFTGTTGQEQAAMLVIAVVDANRTIHARHQTHRASAKKASSGLGQHIIIQLDNQLS